MHISDTKAELRSSVEKRLQEMSERNRAAESRSLSRRLIEAIPAGTPVCGYVPLKTEADITLLLEEVLKRGDPLFLPVFDGTLTFRRCTDLSKLEKGTLGIREPLHGEPLDLKTLSDLTVVIPGRAFDRRGNRLGRGNGGYDRWIEDARKVLPTIRCIGAALECQIINEIPVEPHDQRMDALATARDMEKTQDTRDKTQRN